MKRKSLILTLALTVCMAIGGIQVVSAKQPDLKNVKTVKMGVNDIFIADNSNSTFSINPQTYTKSLNSENYTVNVDMEKAIADIEAGLVSPLLTNTLPKDIKADSKMDFTDTKGNTEHVKLQDAQTLANCSHVYTPGVFSAHAGYSDGSCKTTTYEALRCYNCNTIWLLEVIGTSSYRVCPH